MKNLLLSLSLLLSISLGSLAQSTENVNPTNQMVLNTHFENGTTYLTWETKREINTSYFIIEKSKDGENFEFITTLKAGGSTFKSTHYQWEDFAFLDSSCQYKVTLVTMEGIRITAISCPFAALSAQNSK